MNHRLVPSRETLTSFLCERRRRRSVAQVAELLGYPAEEVERVAAARKVLSADDRISWRVAAEWLLDAWPLETLFAILGPESDLLPRALLPTRLELRLPAYLVLALRVQADIEPLPHRIVRPATFRDYVTDLLERAITPETVDALRGVQDFLVAYHFPDRVR